MNKQELEIELKSMLSELLPILKKNNNAEDKEAHLFISRSGTTIVKIKDDSERNKFNAPIKLLTSKKEISERFSEEFIQSRFVDCCHKLLADETRIDEYIKRLVTSLSDGVKDYFVVSEIENIRLLEDDRYEFIDSTIKLLRKEDLPFEVSTPDNEMLNKPAIFTRVKAGETGKAQENALHNFMTSMTLIRLYVPTFKPCLKGSLLGGNREISIYNETKQEVSTNWSIVGDVLLNHAYLNRASYDQLKDAGIDELRKASSITKIVKECLYWYGLGVDEKYPAARLLNFVTVLESGLKRKEETTELKRSVSERGAFLLSDKYEDRKRIFTELKGIYDTRSKVVHTGVLIGDKDLASLAGGYARAVLIEFIRKSKELNGNFNDFIGWIDDVKLGKK